MRKLSSYLAEAQKWYHNPTTGDDFGIELDDGTLLETFVLEHSDHSIVLGSDSTMWTILESWGYLSEVDALDETSDEDIEIDFDAIAADHAKKGEEEALSRMPDASRPIDYTAPERPIYTDPELKHLQPTLDEAEYQGRNVPLGKPMRGDVKKFKVYVKDPKTGNVKKVNFGHGGTSAKRLGQKTMKIKKSNPARRRSFRARHHCENPGPRTKARYWSCRAW